MLNIIAELLEGVCGSCWGPAGTLAYTRSEVKREPEGSVTRQDVSRDRCHGSPCFPSWTPEYARMQDTQRTEISPKHTQSTPKPCPKPHRLGDQNPLPTSSKPVPKPHPINFGDPPWDSPNFLGLALDQAWDSSGDLFGSGWDFPGPGPGALEAS